MKKIVQRLPLIFIFLMAASCKPDALETTVNPVDQKLVINSMITPDTSLWISVTRSNIAFPSFNNLTPSSIISFIEGIAVNDALVTLTCNGHTDTLIAQSWGTYKLEQIPVHPGKIYQLTVFRPSTGETAFAYATIPSKSKIRQASVKVNYHTEHPTLELNASFEDNSTTRDFYIASYYAVDIGDLKKHPEMLYHFMNKKRVDFDLINDLKQTNGTISLRKSFPEECINDTLTFMVSPVEEGYYRFLEQHKLSGGLLSQLAGEVVRYKTNIQGGYGYFSLRLPAIARIAPFEFEILK